MNRKGMAIKFTAKEKAELVPIDLGDDPLKPNEIFTRTVVSLISSGTEVVGGYSAHCDITAKSYPMSTGYATISQVEETGSEVKGLKTGDFVLGVCYHQSVLRGDAAGFIKVPAGLSPELAVFGRMAKIPMPAFVRCEVRPAETLVVCGLGLVGMLAAQLGQRYGYETIACDPCGKRRAIAQACGVANVLDKVPVDDPRYAKKVGFGLDCSGHEQAVLDLCNIVRPWGEVSMVGVPWMPRTSLLAQKILHSVFYNFINLRSGWELRPPRQESHSEPRQHATAMQWILEGGIKIDPCVYCKVSPKNPQEQYQTLLHGKLDALTFMFDWKQL